MFDLAPQARVVFEIGSCWGHWAHRARKQLRGAEVYCVDPWYWDVSPQRPGGRKGHTSGKHNFLEWEANAEGCVPVCAPSLAVAPNVPDESIDLVFVDASHFTRDVAADVSAWWPKVSPGGVLVGHDWDGDWGPKVRAGVLSVWERSDFSVERLYWSGKHLGECYYRRK